MPPKTKLTDARQQRILEAITAGATRHAAALHADIDDSTLYLWLKRNPGFSSLVARAEADVEVRCTAIILRAAEMDARHAEWWLERRRSADYGRREHVDLGGDAEQPLHVTIAFDRPSIDVDALPSANGRVLE